jgi:ectoine hydroxylase-related dioxygenase (phytanoyl-CoA dioxygenase family)
MDTQNNYEFEKYVCTKETLKHTIDNYGVAIIPNVLDESECNKMVSMIWDFFEHISQKWETPINRNDEKTWREFYKLYPLHSMLIQHWGIGHAHASWDVRQNMNIIEIFAHFWNCQVEDLLVSFDGLSFNLPPEITKKGWNRGNTWYHTDQSFTINEFKCIQSFITGLDINEYDATLSFMEGSNKYHHEFKNHYNITDKSDWYKLTKEQETFYYNKGCHIKNVKCPKGSLVFWDSRTIHCGIEADKKRTVPNIRAVIYLCYMPRNLCDEKNLKKKQNAFNELRTTNHYPCKIKLFAKEPRSYGGMMPTITPIESPVLTNLGKKLAGF